MEWNKIPLRDMILKSNIQIIIYVQLWWSLQTSKTYIQSRHFFFILTVFRRIHHTLLFKLYKWWCHFFNKNHCNTSVRHNENTLKIKNCLSLSQTLPQLPSDHHLTVLWIVTAFMWHVMAGQTVGLTTQISGKSKTNSKPPPIEDSIMAWKWTV